jgi:hypothetical protein
MIPRYQASNVFAVEDHGETTVSRLGVVGFGAGASGRGGVAVRLEFSDTRAAKILKEKAKKIPVGSPALIFVDGTGGSASFSDWREVLMARFQRKFHARVGARKETTFPTTPRY